MSWPDGALLALSAIPCSLSPLISRVHSFLFSDWRRNVSSKFFDTRVPSISTEELVLPRHACCVLIRLRCNKHSLQLSSYLSMIGQNRDSLLQLLPSFLAADTRTKTPLISVCNVQLRTLYALTLWRLSVSLRPLVQALGSCSASGAPWSSIMPQYL